MVSSKASICVRPPWRENEYVQARPTWASTAPAPWRRSCCGKRAVNAFSESFFGAGEEEGEEAVEIQIGGDVRRREGGRALIEKRPHAFPLTGIIFRESPAVATREEEFTCPDELGKALYCCLRSQRLGASPPFRLTVREALQEGKHELIVDAPGDVAFFARREDAVLAIEVLRFLGRGPFPCHDRLGVPRVILGALEIEPPDRVLNVQLVLELEGDLLRAAHEQQVVGHVGRVGRVELGAIFRKERHLCVAGPVLKLGEAVCALLRSFVPPPGHERFERLPDLGRGANGKDDRPAGLGQLKGVKLVPRFPVPPQPALVNLQQGLCECRVIKGP
jgi:hypothetical protein